MRVFPIAHVNNVDLHPLGQLHDLDAGAHEGRAGLHGAEAAVADRQGYYLGSGGHAVLVGFVREVARRYGGYVCAVSCCGIEGKNTILIGKKIGNTAD